MILVEYVDVDLFFKYQRYTTLGLTMKCNNGVYGIYMDGMRIYSLHKRSYKYNRHLYAKQTTDDRIELLEIILYHYFGPGGKGSSLVIPKKVGDQNGLLE